MLTVYGRADSSNVQAVMWTIAELDLAYERKDAGHRFGGTDTAEYRAMNPNGLVPTLRDGTDEPIFESAAIMRYLAARYGTETFWPSDPAGRAQVDKWAEWAKTEFVARFTVPVFWAFYRTKPAERDKAAIARALDILDVRLDIAEDRLRAHAFLAGDAFTLADCQFGHTLYRYFTLEIARRQRPILEDYYSRLKDRPAFREHVMVPYDQLKVE